MLAAQGLSQAEVQGIPITACLYSQHQLDLAAAEADADADAEVDAQDVQGDMMGAAEEAGDAMESDATAEHAPHALVEGHLGEQTGQHGSDAQYADSTTTTTNNNNTSHTAEAAVATEAGVGMADSLDARDCSSAMALDAPHDAPVLGDAGAHEAAQAHSPQHESSAAAAAASAAHTTGQPTPNKGGV